MIQFTFDVGDIGILISKPNHKIHSYSNMYTCGQTSLARLHAIVVFEIMLYHITTNDTLYSRLHRWTNNHQDFNTKHGRWWVASKETRKSVASTISAGAGGGKYL